VFRVGGLKGWEAGKQYNRVGGPNLISYALAPGTVTTLLGYSYTNENIPN
jgi:hypothetical protein